MATLPMVCPCIMLRRLLVPALSVLLACAPTTAPITSKEVRIYSFGGYFPEAVLRGFEADTGVHPVVETYASNEELLAALGRSQGTWDVVIPSDYAIEALIRGRGLEPLDLRRIPGVLHLDPSFLHPYFDPGGATRGAGRGGASSAIDHQKYSLPYLWGTFGIAYVDGSVLSAPTRWADLWRPELKGHVAVVDDAREMLGLTLLTQGENKNSTKPAAIDAAREKLLSLEPSLVAIDSESTEERLLDGQATVAALWGGDAAQAMRKDPGIRYVLPEEGAGIWFDNLAIPKGAPHPDAAYALIDYLLKPEVSAILTQETGFSNPNRDGLDALTTKDPEAWRTYQGNPASNPSPADLSQAILVKDVGAEASALHEAAWEAVKARFAARTAQAAPPVSEIPVVVPSETTTPASAPQTPTSP